MTPAEIQEFLQQSKDEATSGGHLESVADTIEAGRSAAQKIADRLNSDDDFRKSVQHDPSLLVGAGMPKPAVYDFLLDLAYPASTQICRDHSQTCGNTCIVSKCVCTHNTVPWKGWFPG
jgi:hypothetical protein